jgi:hypothetical protein
VCDLGDLIDACALKAAREENPLRGVENSLLDLAGLVARRAARPPDATLGRSAFGRRRHWKPSLHLRVKAPPRRVARR